MHRCIMTEKSRGWIEKGRVNERGCKRDKGKKIKIKTSERK